MAQSVVLRFLGDASQLSRTFQRVGAESNKFSAGVKKGFGLAGLSMAGAGVAAAGFAKTAIGAFKDAEKAQSRLEDAFKRFPSLADTNIGALRKLNTQLAQKTRFDDDATASGQAVLAQFGLTGKQIERITPLLQDYAAKTGKDLPGAAQVLGKALGGQARALKAIGIDFKSTGDKTADLESLMGLLQQKVGGFAEREGKTASGRAEILKNKFGELQEKVGEFLVPALDKLVGFLTKVADWFEKLDPSTQKLIAGVAALTAGVWLLNIAMSANPVGLMIIGAGALAVAMVTLYEKSKPFKDFVDGIGVSFMAMVKQVQTGIELLIRAYNLLPFHKDVQIGGGGATTLGPAAKQYIKANPNSDAAKTFQGKRAAGGPTSPYGTYLVGERGPEVLTMGSRGGYVHPNGGGGGNTIIINSGLSERAIIDAIARYDRRNGTRR